MVLKCTNCGAENPDHAFYCGKCAKELRGIPSTPPSERADPQHVDHAIWDATSGSPPDPLIAVAINVRRIVVILMLGLFLTLGSILVSWWTSYFYSNYDTDIGAVRAIVSVWGAISAIVIGFGLYYVVFRKKITRP